VHPKKQLYIKEEKPPPTAPKLIKIRSIVLVQKQFQPTFRLGKYNQTFFQNLDKGKKQKE
jgi:hypothetical protein